MKITREEILDFRQFKHMLGYKISIPEDKLHKHLLDIADYVEHLEAKLAKYEENVVVDFIGEIQHFYEKGDDLVVLPKGRSHGENMYPYGKKVKVLVIEEK